MKKLALTIATLLALPVFVHAGTEYSGKEMKQVAPPPCPEWYGDTEWNVALWGAYGFGGDTNHLDTLNIPVGDSRTVDEVVGDDGAWGGGVDVKYFFHRYFGIGVEGYGLTNDRDYNPAERLLGFTPDNDAFGAVKGTITLRYPIGCSRFAPYVYAGGGVLFWDQQRVFYDPQLGVVRRDNDDVRAVGEVGGGLEVRITRHVGWIADVSWNFTEDENFGMVRSGINFAF